MDLVTIGPLKSAQVHILEFEARKRLLRHSGAFKGTERDIRLHTGPDTLVFTVCIPAGVENGTLLSFKRPLGNGQEMKLQFRVRITE